MVGVIGIYGVTLLVEPINTDVSSIDGSFVGKRISVSGFARNIRGGNDFFFDLSDGKKAVKAVVFRRLAKDNVWIFNITENQAVVVEGVVQIYKNELEIIGDKIRRL